MTPLTGSTDRPRRLADRNPLKQPGRKRRAAADTTGGEGRDDGGTELEI